MYAGFLLCEACDTPTTWPIWVRYELRDYHPHCWSCYARRNHTFTAEAAIAEARDIISIPSIIRPRVRVGGAK